MVQSLLGSEKKADVYDLAVADGIKEMLVIHGFTRDKILNTMMSNLAETLHIDYYVALIIYKSAKKCRLLLHVLIPTLQALSSMLLC
jgi:hypothetical protein